MWCSGFILFTTQILYEKHYDGTAEAIVVLTGGEGRIETGLSLLEQYKAKRMLISGVHPSVTTTQILSRYKRNPTELKDRIDLGKAALNTLGNADETLTWIARHQIQSLIIVTAHYHMPRTLLHLGALLPDVALYPYPVTPPLFQNSNWYKTWQPWYLLLSDYTKLLLTYPQILFVRQ
jgi:uncharacterized SAM-binding protein YcdF (DUF218 family)